MASTVAGVRRTPPAPQRERAPLSPLVPLRYLFALLVVALTVVPLLFVVIGGFKTNANINANPNGLPSPWVFSNYARILGSGQFWRFLGNSALISVVTTVITVALGSMAAFGLSRYSFRGREAVTAFFTIGLLFPLQVAALPVYLLLRRLSLLESPLGVALPSAAFSLAVTIVILRPFMASIPAEIEDAAMVDGLTRLGFFGRIMLRLSGPALVTVGILAFVQSWNGYLLPLLVFTDQSHFTLPLGVATFQSQYSQDTASILAYTSLAIVPALVFFVFAERRIVGGLQGSVKG